MELKLNAKKGGQKVALFSELLLIRETVDTSYRLFVWFSVTNDTPDN